MTYFLEILNTEIRNIKSGRRNKARRIVEEINNWASTKSRGEKMQLIFENKKGKLAERAPRKRFSK